MTHEPSELLAIKSWLKNPKTKALQKKCVSQAAEIERLKTVPMKYRHLAFNAKLQDENAKLRDALMGAICAMLNVVHGDPVFGPEVKAAIAKGRELIG